MEKSKIEAKIKSNFKKMPEDRFVGISMSILATIGILSQTVTIIWFISHFYDTEN